MRSIRPAGRHLLLWGCAVVWVLVVPSLYDRFLVDEGKPVSVVPGVVTPSTARIKFDVRGLDEVDDLGMYRIKGWAFLDTEEKLASGSFEKQVILSTNAKALIYPASTTWSIDIDLFYDESGMELSRAGFESLVYRDGLSAGMYQLGILLKQKESGDEFYSPLDTCIQKTANHLFLREPNAEDCLLFPRGIGQPIMKDMELPAETRQREMWVEQMAASEMQGVYRIQGWVFLTADKSLSAGEFERQVVLTTPAGNLVFAADTVLREDVQKYFSSLGMDLSRSGFSAWIDGQQLIPGRYGLGIILKNRRNNTIDYVNAGRCLTRTEDALILEENGSAACLPASPANGYASVMRMIHFGGLR